MERRYYAFKTIIVVAALGFGLFGYVFGSGGVGRTYTRSNYSAATTMQVTGAKIMSSVGHAVLHIVEFFHG